MENKPMRILVTGFNGQLGFDVVRVGIGLGLDMIGTSSSELDITQEHVVYEFIHKTKPEAIIHCAAYTAVDNAEDQKEKCWHVNVEGTKYLSKAAKEVNAKFMYISTDYVFDGEGTKPFLESDQPNPKGYYGLTKLEGEKVVQEIIKESFIVRISWVFGINGKNFIKTMLRLGEIHDQLKVVNDQVGSPTYTVDLAHLLINVIQSNKFGTYHASNDGFCNWAEFSEEIFRQAGKSVQVIGIPAEEYPTRAVRPLNSRLSKQKLIDNGFDMLPNWQDAVARYLDEITQEVK
jgi:dTDP-4-dehydrorhamnose reductase